MAPRSNGSLHTGFDWLCAALVFCTALAVYVPTLHASIPGGDSGEIVANACSLGVSHPPGYPLLTMLLAVWLRVVPRVAQAALSGEWGDVSQWMASVDPSCNPAWWANLLNALFGAGAAALLALAVTLGARALTVQILRIPPGQRPPVGATMGGWVSGVLGGLSFALSPLAWRYHVGAEVFALNNLFVAAIVLTALRCLLLLRVAADAQTWAQSVVARARPKKKAKEAVDADAVNDVLAGTAAYTNALRRELHWGALLGGLALTNQHTAVLLLAPVMAVLYFASMAVLVAAVGRVKSLEALARVEQTSVAGRSVQESLLLGGMFLVGLAPYSYLPIAATLAPAPTSWGDPSTVAGFLRHLLRQDYGTFQLYSGDTEKDPPLSALARTQHWLDDLQGQIPPLALLALLTIPVFAAMELLSLGRVCRSSAKKPGSSSDPPLPPVAGGFLLLLCASLVVYLGVFHTLSNMPLNDPLLFGVHQRFWMQPNALVSVLLGLAWSGLGAAGLGWMRGRGAAAAAAHSAGLSAQTQLTGIAVPTLGLALFLAFHGRQMEHVGWELDHAGNTVMRDYGLALVRTLPPNATLVTAYDMQWTALSYLQSCEAERRDVTVLNAPILSFTWTAAHRRAHPGVCFPGTHLTKRATEPHAAGAYSLEDLFAANAPAVEGRSAALALRTALPATRDLSTLRLSAEGKALDEQGLSWAEWALVDRGPAGLRFEPRVRCDSGPITDMVRQSSDLALFRDRFGSRSVGREGLVTRPLSSGVFYAGDPIYPVNAEGGWRFLPHGLVKRAVRQGVPDADFLPAAWRAFRAAEHLFTPPTSRTYPADAWEWTTGVDFWKNAEAFSSFLLDTALAELDAPAADEDDQSATARLPPASLPVLEAIRIMEGALARSIADGKNGSVALVKNLGLAYARIVQKQIPLPETTLPRVPIDPGDTKEVGLPTPAHLQPQTLAPVSSVPAVSPSTGIAQVELQPDPASPVGPRPSPTPTPPPPRPAFFPTILARWWTLCRTAAPAAAPLDPAPFDTPPSASLLVDRSGVVRPAPRRTPAQRPILSQAPPLEHINPALFLESSVSLSHWTARAAQRVLDLWTDFLRRPAARSDPSYRAIQQTVAVLIKVLTKQKGNA